MRKSRKRKHGWFYQSTEPGSEVGGIKIDFVHKWKMKDNGYNLSLLVGQHQKIMEGYKKGESIGMHVHNGHTGKLQTFHFKHRKNLRKKIRELVEMYPPKSETRFPYYD